MQRSKQQALMFLLGAVLVGGLLGLSADRVFRRDIITDRRAFYDALGLSETQRSTLDSLAFEQDCAVRALLAPQRPALDSIRGGFRTQLRQVYTPEQRAKVEQREADFKKRREADQAKEPKRQCSAK
jgi:Spy/CpxP family protein refolding chaperone